MSKDRARPFSPKHRKYWIPVTGGMLLIGAINIGIGYCTYAPPGAPPQRIIPVLPAPAPKPKPTDGTIGIAEVPAAVMRAFAVKYPRHIPIAKRLDAKTYELSFTEGAPATPARHITFRDDGTFLGER